MLTSSKLKILNISQNHYVRGGSDGYFFSLAKLLEKKGHKVIPFASAQEKNISTVWSEYFPKPVDFHRPGIKDLFRYVHSTSASKSIGRLIDDESPDLAHLHIYYGQITGSIIGQLRKKGIPIVQTLHEYKLVCPTSALIDHGKPCEACQGNRFWHATARRCNRGSLARSALSSVESYWSYLLGSVSKIDHFLAVSNFVRDKVIALGVPAEKITTVHNFVEIDSYEAKAIPGSYILYFGRLERIKGIFTLLNAMANIRSVRLLIVGDGNDRSEIERSVNERQLSNVTLLGFKQGLELQNLIRGSICTVSPSEWNEPFGLTLIESFALGRPVICSRMGGMPEIVDDCVTGFVVPPGDSVALGDRIQWMANNPKLAVEMGARGRKKVEIFFAPELHYQNISAVYEKVMADA